MFQWLGLKGLNFSLSGISKSINETVDASSTSCSSDVGQTSQDANSEKLCNYED